MAALFSLFPSCKASQQRFQTDKRSLIEDASIPNFGGCPPLLLSADFRDSVVTGSFFDDDLLCSDITLNDG